METEDDTGEIISGGSNNRQGNVFQNIGNMRTDSSGEGTSAGESSSQHLPMNWTPASQSFRRKSHKSYLATWSAQISCDGFAKCLIETCNFISLDLQRMQDHYKTCNGVPNYSVNSCSTCKCWLPTGNELVMHEFKCKAKRKDTSIILPQLKDSTESNINQSGVKRDNPTSSASAPSATCSRLSLEKSGEMSNKEHLIGKKNWPKTTSPADEKKKEAPTPVTNTSPEKAVQGNSQVQPGRPTAEGEYVRRRSFTKQHKTAWDSALRKHKYVKCIFKNCHFLALSVQDMIYHYGYCNGDGSFAKFVCPFCGGRLTKKDLLDIHIRRSHATEGIDDINFPCIGISNEESQPPPLSGENYSFGNDSMRFGGFDPGFPQEAPLEVEIREEPTPFGSKGKVPFEEPVRVGEAGTSRDPKQNNKSNSDPQTEEWETASEESEYSSDEDNSEYSEVEESSSYEEDDYEESSADDSQDNAEEDQQDQHPSEIRSKRDYRDDHIYSKVKMRKICESESADSLSAKRKKMLKHYPSRRSTNEESLRARRDEPVPSKESDNKRRVMRESQLNQSVSGLDASGKNARKPFVPPVPASQETVKRDVLPYYTGIWKESLRTNGFARCLVATCNFISLDLLHMQNHFKNCDGIPENGPNLCPYCESRLPSCVELGIHKARCRANGEVGSSSSRAFQSSSGWKKSSVPQNRAGESSKSGEMESRVELNESENKTREESDSFESNTDATEGEISPRKESSSSLLIGEIMKLKNQEIVDTDRIIQPGPDLPEGQYLRRRSYSKTHKAAWEAALEKHKYVKCLFQNCHFLAMSLEDMIYHFGYCIGDGSFAKFECPHCGGRLTSKAVLDIHIERSHPDKLPNNSEEEGSKSKDEGAEILIYTFDELKQLIAKKELKTYPRNSRKVSLVILDPDEEKAAKELLNGMPDDCLIPYNTPKRKRQMQEDESSDVNNSTSDSKNNACDNSAEKKTRTNDDDKNTYSESQNSRARNLPEELGSDKRDGKETEESSDSETDSGSATDDLAEMTGESNPGTSKTACKTKDNSKIGSKKETPTNPEKPDNQRRASLRKSGTPVKPNNEQKPSKSNQRTLEKPNHEEKHSHSTREPSEKSDDEGKRSHGKRRPSDNSDDEGKRSHGKRRPSDNSDDEGKRSHGDGKTPEKSNSEGKRSHGDGRTPEKSNNEGKRSHGDGRAPEKSNNEGKRSHGDGRAPEKSNDEGKRSHGDGRTPEKPSSEQKPSKGNPKTPEKSNSEGKRSHGDGRAPEKSNGEGKRSHGDGKAPEKSNDEGKRSHGHGRPPEKPSSEQKPSKGNPKTPEKPTNEPKPSKENPKNPEKPDNEGKPSKGNPKTPEKPANEPKPSKGNPKTPEKPTNEPKPSKENPKTPEKPTNEPKPSKGNPKTPEKPTNEPKPSKENPKTPEKPTNEPKPSKGNPKNPEKPTNEPKPSNENPKTPEKPTNEPKPSKGNPKTPEKPNNEQKSFHGNTNTSSLVLEKNSNTKKQETEKERISLRQNTKAENKNCNKNDQETKHDIRPRRKRGRTWQSLSQKDLSEEEHVKEVLDNSDAEGTIYEANEHEGTRQPRVKLAKIEPPKSEGITEETRNPTNRKRGRPPKSTSLRCKVSNVEEEMEQPKRGRSAKTRKCEPEEKKSTNKVKCANCDFECERRLFADHNHKKHAGLSWIEGENPIDLNDEEAVSWSIKQAFKHIKSATCEKCGSVKKSALGFISHVQNCGKSEEEKAALKVKCPHCPSRILKYSLPMHLKLSHFELEGKKSSQENVSVGELPLKRKSALRAVNKFCEVLRQEDDEEETKKKGQFVMYEKGVSKLPKLPSKTRSLWMKMIKEKKRIPCRRGSCLIESSTVQEAKNHHFLCSELPHKCYVCERCDFFSETKAVIQQHVDIHATVDTDYKFESEEEKSEEEADMKYAEDEESELIQYKSKSQVTSVEDTALEASLKARFFAREGLTNERQMRFCRRSLRMTLESEIEEVKKYSPVFPELYTQVSDWIHVKPENATDHFPDLDESILFRINNTKKKRQSDWMKIKRFKADIVEDSAVIFTGGSILSMSWCKYSCLRSSKHNPKQYLAVSSSRKMEKFQNIHEEQGKGSSLIQIYSCGEMKIYNDVVEVPEMVMGIIHDYGEVWDLAWFPLDAYEHSDSETFLTRIGLLGAACQDGTIKIWPICDPDELKPKHSLPLYKIHPKVILELEDSTDLGCLRLAIGRTGTIVGGYTGGLVAVWNLKTIASPFCRTDGNTSILKPIVSFQAHKTSITALSMCQNSDRYICTSGLDRFIKFWDLEYPGNPFENLQKEVCLDNVWPKHWPLTISTFEDIVPSSGKGMVKAIREVYCDKHRTPLALEGTCWSLSFNEWLNILCGCNNIGEVKVRFLRNMFLADETLRYRTGQVVCKTELKFLKGFEYKVVKENVDGESCEEERKKIAMKEEQAEENSAVPRTYDEAWKYFGLVFHDFDIQEDVKQKTTPTKSSKKGTKCLEDYPITSVNKVCWNPNYKRFMQLAIGHHCGLIRIKPLKDSKSDGDVRRFLTDSDYEIGKSGLD